MMLLPKFNDMNNLTDQHIWCLNVMCNSIKESGASQAEVVLSSAHTEATATIRINSEDKSRDQLAMRASWMKGRREF